MPFPVLQTFRAQKSVAIQERALQYRKGAGIQAKIHCLMTISSIRPEIYYFHAIKNEIHFNGHKTCFWIREREK